MKMFDENDINRDKWMRLPADSFRRIPNRRTQQWRPLFPFFTSNSLCQAHILDKVNNAEKTIIATKDGCFGVLSNTGATALGLLQAKT